MQIIDKAAETGLTVQRLRFVDGKTQRDLLPPYEQTAALAGMRFLPPLVLHGAHRASAAEVQAHADVWLQRLQTWPAWPEIDDMDAAVCEVPADARPAD